MLSVSAYVRPQIGQRTGGAADERTAAEFAPCSHAKLVRSLQLCTVRGTERPPHRLGPAACLALPIDAQVAFGGGRVRCLALKTVRAASRHPDLTG